MITVKNTHKYRRSYRAAEYSVKIKNSTTRISDELLYQYRF